MNMDDVGSVQIPDGPIAGHIFAKQRELMHKYEEIERRKGAIVPDEPWHIDDFKVQQRIKELFWRTTEELAEALESPPNLVSWREHWGNDESVRRFFEELADALHFLTEASIIVGIDPLDVHGLWLAVETHNPQPVMSESALRTLVMRPVFHMGLAANCLKNRAWKQSPPATDVEKFKLRVMRTWESFFGLWTAIGADYQDMYQLYHRKNLVNQQRQATGY